MVLVSINKSSTRRRELKIASQFCPSGRLTTDKREIKDFPKLPSATFFIRETLDEIHTTLLETLKYNKFNNKYDEE